MFPYGVVVLSILISVFAWTGQALAGWVIEAAIEEGGWEQVALQANRIKTTEFGKDGKPVEATIMDLNAQTITHVDYKERHYYTTTVQELVQMMQKAQQMASEAMKQWQEELKGKSPEERKMMEQMMQQMMPGPTSKACQEPHIEVRKTSQQATIAGYPTVRYDVLADGKLESELWIAKGITAWQELDSKKLERFSAEMTKAAACGPAKGEGFGADPSWKLANEGYPVREVAVDQKGRRGVTKEVVEVERRTIPTAEFQPPSDFTRKTLQEMMGQ